MICSNVFFTETVPELLNDLLTTQPPKRAFNSTKMSPTPSSHKPKKAASHKVFKNRAARPARPNKKQQATHSSSIRGSKAKSGRQEQARRSPPASKAATPPPKRKSPPRTRAKKKPSRVPKPKPAVKEKAGKTMRRKRVL